MTKYIHKAMTDKFKEKLPVIYDTNKGIVVEIIDIITTEESHGSIVHTLFIHS